MRSLQALPIRRLVQEIDDLFRRGVPQPLASLLERFRQANGDILHALVRLFGAAQEHELFALSNPLMAVVIIESKTEQTDDFRLRGGVFAWHEGSWQGERLFQL